VKKRCLFGRFSSAGWYEAVRWLALARTSKDKIASPGFALGSRHNNDSAITESANATRSVTGAGAIIKALAEAPATARAMRATPMQRAFEIRRITFLQANLLNHKFYSLGNLERQWSTVWEDYSAGGDAWKYLPHDAVRRETYRWGEDGIAGFCDDQQQLCLSLAIWNTRDPILEERLFGLSNSEGNQLASDYAYNATGITLFVDGGMTLFPGFTENG
jgi:hypothetical protein